MKPEHQISPNHTEKNDKQQDYGTIELNSTDNHKNSNLLPEESNNFLQKLKSSNIFKVLRFICLVIIITGCMLKPKIASLVPLNCCH